MELSYSKSFKKEYKKLSKKLQLQLGERAELFKNEPFHPLLNNHELHHPYLGCRSINITGNLRTLYETVSKKITFIRIGTHSELYG